MRNYLIILFVGCVSTALSQNEIVFKDGKSINLQVLNNQLIDIIGESNSPYQLSKSTTEEFTLCFFRKIASNSSYKIYQEDLMKAKNYSKNKDEKMYFIYKIKYINSALWSCFNDNLKFIEDYSKVDKIIPQSDIKIKAFAEDHLSELKKGIGTFDYTELGKKIDLESYSECFARKIWNTFTPKEMFSSSLKIEKKVEEIQEICMADNLKIPTSDKKYDSDYIADSSLLAKYISFINDPKSKGLDFKIKSPKGFINTFADSPNIIRLWRKKNAVENEDPWIFILIQNEKMYENKIDFEKELIDEGGVSMLANEIPNSSNISYFSADDYPGAIFDVEKSNGDKMAIINLWLPNHVVQFFFLERGSNNYNYYRNILISFAKSIKFL